MQPLARGPAQGEAQGQVSSPVSLLVSSDVTGGVPKRNATPHSTPTWFPGLHPTTVRQPGAHGEGAGLGAEVEPVFLCPNSPLPSHCGKAEGVEREEQVNQVCLTAWASGPGQGGSCTPMLTKRSEEPTQADQSPETEQPPWQPRGVSALSDPRPVFSPSAPSCHHLVSHWLGHHCLGPPVCTSTLASRSWHSFPFQLRQVLPTTWVCF